MERKEAGDFIEDEVGRKARTRRVIAGLKKIFPDAHCSLIYSNPLELLIATVLSAQCTDERVNRVTPDLFHRFPTAKDFAEADLEEIEVLVHSTGFYRNKAKNIQNCCRDLVDQHGGEVPDSMEALTQLAGVGRKTANVVLGNAFGIEEGVVVDTHVARLCGRLKITSAKTPEKIEKDLVKLVPREHWTLFSHWIIWHGRRRCGARKPDCPNCEIRELCPSAA